MRSCRINLRGAKGHSWYKNFIEKGPEAFAKNVPPTPFDWKANKAITRPKAYFDLNIDKDKLGRLTFELASDILPITVLNFIRLCGNDNKYSYRGTKIHRVHKNIALMAGDVEKNDGSGNFSSFGKRHFQDENFIIPHSGRGLLSMASVGVDTNGSQFYVSFTANRHLNGRCMVFGRLIEGEEYLAKIESMFTFRGVPASDILISECGVFDHEEFVLAAQDSSHKILQNA